MVSFVWFFVGLVADEEAEVEDDVEDDEESEDDFGEEEAEGEFPRMKMMVTAARMRRSCFICFII